MSDLNISGSVARARSESDIRLNYGDTTKIIAASNDIGASSQAQFFSTDGGATWSQSSLPLTSTDTSHSDPQVDWTSDGTAWALTIGVTAVPAGTRVRAYQSTDNGSTWTFDGTPSGTQNGADREIIWVDHSAASTFRDQVYALWHNGTPAFFARRTTGSGGGWQTPIQVSGSETTGIGIGGDIKTNRNGDLFVFWPDADGSRRILVAKSTNGGASFGSPVTIATTFANSRRLSIPADSGRKARVYVSAGAFRTSTQDLVYAVWTDLSGESGCTTGSGPDTNAASTCKTRVWFSRSTDGGSTWSTPVMLNNQSSKNDQFHSKLHVDDTTGKIVVTYHDTVDDSTRLKTDLWMQKSTDDGQTWSAAEKLTSGQSDETTAGADGNQYGDYNGLTGFGGMFFPTWTDRRSGGNEQIWTTAVNIRVTPTITWPTPTGITYGTPLPASALNATVTPAVPGTFTYNPLANTCPLPAGNDLLTVNFTPADSNNFNSVTGNQSITVAKATPNLTWPAPPDIDDGDPLPAAAYNVSASFNVCGTNVPVPGSFTFAPAVNTILPVGTHTLTAFFMPTDTANYNPVTATAQIHVLTGRPVVQSVTFSPTVIPLNIQDPVLTVTVLIKNDSIRPHTTQGPNPGFEYSEGDTFQTKGFPSIDGAYRMAVDLDETTYKVPYLYRWGFGKTLAPGESVQMTGCIRFHNIRHNGHYYVAMIQEVDGVVQDQQGKTLITVVDSF